MPALLDLLLTLFLCSPAALLAGPGCLRFEGVRQLLRTWAVQHELLDDREGWILGTDWYWSPPEETVRMSVPQRRLYQDLDALRTIRARAYELADAPCLADASRFPPRDVCRANLEINQRFISLVELRCGLELHNQARYDPIREEAQRSGAIWSSASDVNTNYYYVATRRQCLAQLRDLLGKKNFYQGRLPCPIPLDRIRIED